MRHRHLIAGIAVVAVAALFRLSNLGYDSLGHDEAYRANWTHHGSLAEARRVPPLMFLMLRTIQHNVGRSELVLRLPFALAGIACVVVLYQFSRRHLDQGSAVLIASLAACHPVLVLYSRTVKVFSLEALACAVLIWLGLEVYRKPTRRQLVLFTVVALVGIGFTFTGSLVVAAWMPLLGWAFLRRANNRPSLRWSFVGASCILAVAAGGCYVWLAGMPHRQSLIHYFTTVEDVWPRAYTPSALAAWLLVSVKGAGQYVLGISNDWPPLSWCVAFLELVAIAASLGVLWQRCRPFCVAVIILAVEVILAGALRMWPFGNVRTTTFLVPIVVLATGCGLWQFVRRMGWSPAPVAAIAFCLFIPTTRVAKSTMLSPSVREHIRPIIAHVRSNLQPGDAIFVYYGATSAFEYYAELDEHLWRPDDESVAQFVNVRWKDSNVPVQVQPALDRQNPGAFADRFEAWIARHRRVWFLFAHNWKNEQKDLIDHLEREYKLLDAFQTTDASVHLFTQ